MTNAIWQRNIVDGSGNILPGATVAVFDTEGGSLVTLYDGDDVPITNPVVADANGYAFFYAPPGKYYLRVVFGPSATPYPDVLVGTTADDGVSTLKILDANVTEAKIATGAVTEDKIGASAVTRSKVNKDIVTQVADITELRALTGMVDGQAVEMLGYSYAADSGGGEFYWSSSDETAAVSLETSGYWGATIPPVSDPTGATGAWKRRCTIGLTPLMFGCAGDGVTDDSAPLQAFFDFIADNEMGDPQAGGVFALDSSVTLSPASGFIKTRRIVGNMLLLAKSPLDVMITFDGCRYLEWAGEVRTCGSPTVSTVTAYASRTTRTGIRITNSASMRLAKAEAINFYSDGIIMDSVGGNNNFPSIGAARCRDCGSGQPSTPSYSLSGNWSNPVNSGSANLPSQRTTVDVDQLPPSSLITGLADWPSAGVFVEIGGRLHQVYDVDDVAGTIDVFPWIGSGETPGAFTYFFGAGVKLIGADQSVVGIDHLDAIRCGLAHHTSASYGPVVGRLHATFCGIGFAFGNSNASATQTFQINGLYVEDNKYDILRVTGTTIAKGIVVSDYALNLGKVVDVADAVAVDGSPANLSNNLNSVILQHQGESYTYEKRPNNRSSLSSSIAYVLNRSRSQQEIYERNSWTINMEFDQDLNRLFGYDSSTLVFVGSGANHSPTGSFTFNPPSGWTVNGGASFVDSGFSGAPLYAIYADVPAANIFVARVSG